MRWLRTSKELKVHIEAQLGSLVDKMTEFKIWVDELDWFLKTNEFLIKQVTALNDKCRFAENEQRLCHGLLQ